MPGMIDKLNEFELQPVKWYFPEVGMEITARDLCTRIDRAAIQLVNYGIGPGDAVGLMMNNSLEYVVLLYAIWINRSIAVPLQQRASQNVDYRTYLYHFHQTCEFKALYYDDDRLQETLEELGKLADAQALKTDWLDTSPQPVADPLRKTADYPSDMTCFLQFSSGSTGAPKAVEVTHGMMTAQVDALATNHNKCIAGVTQSTDVESGTWLPFSHNMGLFIGVIYPVYVGTANTIVSPSFYLSNPAAWYRLVSERRIGLNFVTSSIHTSTLRALTKVPAGELDLSCLHLCLGGESVSPVVVRRTEEVLSRFGFTPEQIHIGYGLSENTLTATCSRPGRISTQHFICHANGTIEPATSDTPTATPMCAVGEPNHNCTMTIHDEHGNELPDLVLGEIHLAGPCVMQRYFRDPERTSQVLRDGRLLTGDLGFSYQGEFYCHSRKDDLVIIGGRNLVPDDIELATEALDFVVDGGAVLVMIMEEATGQSKPAMLYETDTQPDQQELREQRKQIQQAIYERCELLVSQVVHLPPGGVERTDSGKKKRKAVKANYLESESHRKES